MRAGWSNPIAVRRAVRAAQADGETFGTFALKLVDTIETGFRNAKHRAQWRTTLTTYAAPICGVQSWNPHARAVRARDAKRSRRHHKRPRVRHSVRCRVGAHHPRSHRRRAGHARHHYRPRDTLIQSDFITGLITRITAIQQTTKLEKNSKIQARSRPHRVRHFLRRTYDADRPVGRGYRASAPRSRSIPRAWVSS
jgi:hypothetical protein